jgi:hypothetical protein
VLENGMVVDVYDMILWGDIDSSFGVRQPTSKSCATETSLRESKAWLLWEAESLLWET